MELFRADLSLIVHLSSPALQLSYLNSLASRSLSENSVVLWTTELGLLDICPVSGYGPCLCLPLKATLGRYKVTPPSLLDQDFFPPLQVILGTALGSHQSQVVRRNKATVAGSPFGSRYHYCRKPSPPLGVPYGFDILNTLGRCPMIALVHLAKAEYGCSGIKLHASPASSSSDTTN